MYPSTVTVLLVLMTSSLVASQDSSTARGTLITTPSVVYKDRQHQTCVTFVGLPRLQVTVSIATKKTGVSEFHQLKNVNLEESGCFQWDLGPYKNNLNGIYTLKVVGHQGTYYIEKTCNVTVETGKYLVFVQTKKPIYKPGERVEFRVLILDSRLRPVMHPIHNINIKNPSNRAIKKWTNETVGSQGGFVTLELPLAENTALGAWSICVTPQEHAKEQTATKFKVKKYVLRRYEVSINTADYMMRSSLRLHGQVCAQYTFGKPLNGTLKLKFVKKGENGETFAEQNRTMQIKGCVGFDENNFDVSHNDIKKVAITAVAIENGTDVKLKYTKRVKVMSEEDMYQATFNPHSRRYYKPGLPYSGKITLTHQNGLPASNIDIRMEITKNDGSQTSKLYISDANGEIPFSLPPYNAATKTIRLKIYRSNCKLDSLKLNEWSSPSRSFLQIEPYRNVVHCGQTISLTVLHMKESSVRLYYEVVSNGRQVTQGSHVHNYISSKVRTYLEDGSYTLRQLIDGESGRPVIAIPLPIQVTGEMSPLMKVIVYYVRTDGEVVADMTVIEVPPCTSNQVRANFNSQMKAPDELTTLTIKAQPGSFCAVSVIDKSVHLAAGGVEKNTVTLPEFVKKLGRFNLKKKNILNILENDGDHCRQKYGSGYESLHFVDSMEAFRTAGMVVMSDLSLYNRNCTATVYHSEGTGREVSQDHLPTQPETPLHDELNEILLRDFFPESWLWELKSIGERGEEAIWERLPHTITNWTGSAVCSHVTSGLGIAPPFSIRSFQDFFLSLSLPYSVKLGETLRVPVTVFNYLPSCVGVEITLVNCKSPHFTLVDGAQHTVCICGEESKTRHFKIKPNVVGSISIDVVARSVGGNVCVNHGPVTGARDRVIRDLLVETEGRPVEKTQTALICPDNRARRDVREVMQLDMPGDVVNGSAEATIKCTGDIMGPTLEGLDKLLRMPIGCGEQIMLRFAPDVYILEYVESTNQLTPAIEKKAKEQLIKGYQKELTKRHNDGSYSAFISDSSGSTWLTAFVIKSFARAKTYMDISTADLEISMNWLIQKQNRNGCFREVGRIIHKELLGGLRNDGDTFGLTTYVLIALMESQEYVTLSNIPSVIDRGFQCLLSQQVSDTYRIAMLSYAHTLRSKPNAVEKQRIARLLSQRAIVNGDKKHWNASSTGSSWKSTDVEVTSYVLLSLLQNRGMVAVHESLPIVKWLTSQRNSYGGFRSTQDTVMALQALSRYASFTYSPGCSSTVSVSGLNLRQDLLISDENKLGVINTAVSVPNTVSVNITGNTCVVVQSSLRYKVQNLRTSNAGLQIKPVEVLNADKCSVKKLKICVRYTGGGISSTESQMGMIDVKMVSGWEPIEDSVERLLNMAWIGVDDFEIHREKTVSLYIKKFTADWTCVEFKVEQNHVVESPKPATVTVYDYYNNDELSVTHFYEIHATCGELEVATVGCSFQCPVCSKSKPADYMQKFCNARFAYVILGQSKGLVKVMKDLRLRRPTRLSQYLSVNMVSFCSCAQLSQITGGQQAVILTNHELKPKEGDRDWSTLDVDSNTIILRLTRPTENRFRNAARRNSC